MAFRSPSISQQTASTEAVTAPITAPGLLSGAASLTTTQNAVNELERAIDDLRQAVIGTRLLNP